jgi:hypothetical protein
MMLTNYHTEKMRARLFSRPSKRAKLAVDFWRAIAETDGWDSLMRPAIAAAERGFDVIAALHAPNLGGPDSYDRRLFNTYVLWGVKDRLAQRFGCEVVTDHIGDDCMLLRFPNGNAGGKLVAVYKPEVEDVHSGYLSMQEAFPMTGEEQSFLSAWYSLPSGKLYGDKDRIGVYNFEVDIDTTWYNEWRQVNGREPVRLLSTGVILGI